MSSENADNAEPELDPSEGSLRLPEDFGAISSQIKRSLNHATENANDQEDAVQEAYRRYYDWLEQGKRPPRNLVGWLVAVAQRYVVDQLRRRRPIAAGIEGGAVAETSTPLHASRAANWIPHARRNFVAKYRQSKPHLVLVALLSRFSPIRLKATPHNELAAQLGVTGKTVSIWWSESKDLLRQELVAFVNSRE